MTESLIQKLRALRIVDGTADFSGTGRYIRGRNDAIEEMLGIIGQHESDECDCPEAHEPHCTKAPL